VHLSAGEGGDGVKCAFGGPKAIANSREMAGHPFRQHIAATVIDLQINRFTKGRGGPTWSLHLSEKYLIPFEEFLHFRSQYCSFAVRHSSSKRYFSRSPLSTLVLVNGQEPQMLGQNLPHSRGRGLFFQVRIFLHLWPIDGLCSLWHL